jgi:NAD(P)H dehydrogenase (quinone)
MTAKILITGATGNLGSDVVNLLLTKTSSGNVAILIRNKDNQKTKEWQEKGVDVRVGDYDDFESLVKSFQNVDKLYFISGNDISKRTKQHENVVKAAKTANVKHIIYTSFQRKNETETSPIAMVADAHIKTEQWIKDSGVDYTILKHNVYADMLPLFIGERVFDTGTIYLPAGDGKAAFATRGDMANAAVAILTSDGHLNKEYDITSDTATSYHDIAAYLTEISGKTITYISPSQEEFKKTLSEAGVPEEYIGVFAGFSEAIKEGEFDKISNTLEQLNGNKPTSVRTFLQKVYSSEAILK